MHSSSNGHALPGSADGGEGDGGGGAGEEGEGGGGRGDEGGEGDEGDEGDEGEEVDRWQCKSKAGGEGRACAEEGGGEEER